MANKRRTAAQIRATKKLVAMNKKRARAKKNRSTKRNAAGPRKTLARRIKSAIQLKRGRKATAEWVRAGMPDKRNRPRKKQCNPRRSSGPKLTLAQGRKLYELGKRAPKTPIAIVKRNGSKVSIVTGKAARKLGNK